jgi:hypothetical protein
MGDVPLLTRREALGILLRSGANPLPLYKQMTVLMLLASMSPCRDSERTDYTCALMIDMVLDSVLNK